MTKTIRLDQNKKDKPALDLVFENNQNLKNYIEDSQEEVFERNNEEQKANLFRLVAKYKGWENE